MNVALKNSTIDSAADHFEVFCDRKKIKWLDIRGFTVFVFRLFSLYTLDREDF